MRTEDMTTRLRAGMAQLLGAPLHYGLLAALCCAYASSVSESDGILFKLRRRDASADGAPECSIVVSPGDAVMRAHVVVRRLARCLDECFPDASACGIEEWEVEVFGTTGRRAVLRPYDPAPAGDWHVDIATGMASAEPLGEVWRRMVADLAGQFAAASIVDVSRVLAGRTAHDVSGVVLTLIHGADGSVTPFAPLAGRLTFPVRAFRGIPEHVEAALSLPDLARRYVDELCEVDDGPTHWLGGHSFGALVAREMADLLKSRGKRVLPVISLDPSLALAARERTSDPHTELVTLLKAVFPPVEAERFLSVTPSEHDIAVRLRQRVPAARLGQVMDMRACCLALLKAYEPDPDPAVPVSFLHARDSLLPDWSALARRHQVYGVEVPGDHFSMLSEPHVSSVAAIVQSLCPEPCHD